MKDYKKKFFYIELITLIGFQVLLFFAFQIRINDVDSIYEHRNVLRLTLPDDKPSTNIFLKTYNAPDIFKEWKSGNKKIVRVDLKGDETDVKRRLNFIRNEALRLEYTYDTTDILKVHFSDENTYGQFIELLNIMEQDKHTRYMLFQNDFYILGVPVSDSINSITYKLRGL